MNINIRGNVDKTLRDMRNIAKSQVPYATSKAINEIAKMCEKEILKQINQNINNPTAFTKKAVFVSYSNKNQSPIRATVGIKDKQAEYLIFVEEGGISVATGKAKPVPTSSSKNRFGNLPKSKTKAIGNGKVFSGKPSGRPGGIYQRMGTKRKPKLKMIASWQHSTRHTPRTRFAVRVMLIVKRNVEKVLRKQMALAISSMR